MAKVGVYWGHNAFRVILVPLILFYLFKTATIDPGFVPVQPKDAHDEKYSKDYKNYLILGGNKASTMSIIKLRYCSECNIFQPPRTVHCFTCKACILVYDHHCSFVANCVGKRNFKYHFLLVFCLFLNFWHVIVQNTYDLSRRIQAAMAGDLMSAIPWVHFIKSYGSAIYILPVAVIGFLAGQRYTYILFRRAKTNITTQDEISETYKGSVVNPFDLGSKRANFRDRIWNDEKPPLFDPNAVYNPTPYTAPTMTTPISKPFLEVFVP